MASRSKIILPGETLGVLGSGQLGRMFAIAAKQMGYRVHVYSPDRDTPAGQVADKEWTASYGNKKALQKFAKSVSVVTFEFENIPIETVKIVEKFAPTRPFGSILHTTQNRLREKRFLAQKGIPVAKFTPASKKEDFIRALQKEQSFPFVVKTADFGYDGKGQALIRNQKELDAWLKTEKMRSFVIEEFVPFEKEISVVGVRSLKGEFSHFGVLENIHKNHILDLTISPARVSKKTEKAALHLAEKILNAFNVVGVMCVEMFLTRAGKIVVNELAPRPHNSGHLTLDGFSTNQFEQQVRSICGLPLAKAERLSPCAMSNLLGDLWKKGAPKWDKALKKGNVKLHLYGKKNALPGRKMGHLTTLAPTLIKAIQTAKAARKALT